MHETSPERVDLEELVSLFLVSPAELGQLQATTAAEMPAVYRKLLAHEHHMTVTVEAHHGCPVDVEVLARHETPTHYARKILLRRQRDGAVVQFGIMRVRLDVFRDEVRQEILAARRPLGRILIEHDVFREIQLCTLWRIQTGPALGECFSLDRPKTTYGRTARILCNHRPAIELLEIVAPED